MFQMEALSLCHFFVSPKLLNLFTWLCSLVSGAHFLSLTCSSLLCILVPPCATHHYLNLHADVCRWPDLLTRHTWLHDGTMTWPADIMLMTWHVVTWQMCMWVERALTSRASLESKSVVFWKEGCFTWAQHRLDEILVFARLWWRALARAHTPS